MIQKQHASIIFNLSSLSFLSSFYGFYKHHYIICFVPFLVGCTTMLYWHNPVYSWRRNLDIFVVIICSMYQDYYAMYSEYALLYYFFKVLGILCYPIGIFYSNKNMQFRGILWHGGIHILANISNIILYSGNLKYTK